MLKDGLFVGVFMQHLILLLILDIQLLNNSLLMKKILNGYFYGTKNELRGSIFLCVLILSTAIIRYVGFESRQNIDIDITEFQRKARIIEAATSDNTYTDFDTDLNTTTAPSSPTLFYFNPNIASKADFERLGLSGRTAQSIINYRNKGGQFYKPADFKKIYTLSEADYERLAPYIDLPSPSFGKNQKRKTTEQEKVVELFIFNPNTATKDDFERLGLSGRTAQSIINYRDKGGQFYKVEDFKKIYTLSDADFERLKPFIAIPKTEKVTAQQGNNTDTDLKKDNKTNYIKKSESVIVDVNQATVEDFQQLTGIGEGYAKRIVNYRNKLGGFVAISQVQEVYGLPKETYETIEKQLTVKASTIQKISINAATYEDLVQHPYIDSKRANAIVKFRKQHGNFQSVDDLSKIYAIPKSTLERIKPYLKL